MNIAERKFIQTQKSAETLQKASEFTIDKVFTYYATVKDIFSVKCPWAHRSKKGPGRKHQQTKTMTKQERYPVEPSVG